MASWYRTGTVAVTNGSKNVTGTGTSWVNNVQPGDAFIGPDGVYYEVDVVGGNGSLTLVENYAGATASGGAYKIIPTQGRVRDLAAAVLQLVNDYGSVEAALNVLSGNVGIGVSPTYRLDVSSGAGNVARIASSGSTLALMRFAGTATTNEPQIGCNGNDLAVYTGGTERVRILDGSGNVGIGTSTIPAGRRLVVAGGAMRLDNDSQMEWGGSSAGIYGNSADNTVSIFTATTLRLRLKAAGQLNLVPLASDPSGAGAGDMYFNSTTGKFRGHNGSGWVDLN